MWLVAIAGQDVAGLQRSAVLTAQQRAAGGEEGRCGIPGGLWRRWVRTVPWLTREGLPRRGKDLRGVGNEPVCPRALRSSETVKKQGVWRGGQVSDGGRNRWDRPAKTGQGTSAK